MYISNFRILNYKSFLDSGDVKLLPGVNIITGKNNSGKTALLQALGLTFHNNPHKSLKTSPKPDQIADIYSSILIEFDVSKVEIEDFIFTQQQILLPTSEKYGNGADFSGRTLFDRLEDRVKVIVTFVNGVPTQVSFPLFGIKQSRDATFVLNVDPIKRSLTQERGTSGASATFYGHLAHYLKTKVYSFQTERFSKGTSSFGTNVVLKTDVTNLAEVLNNLQSNRIRFEKYNKLVNAIFPSIYEVSVHSTANNNVEILLWNEDPISERKDLAISLSNSGTGVGQVLAMLYVILNSDEPTVILIDEPNSFLHPGASRKLMEILKENSKHQFIISTHSPEVITSSNPTSISMIKTERVESKIIPVNVSEAREQRICLAEIGSRLSDVFGFDNVLWVEGKTEELCFPKIIEKMGGLPYIGLAILAVKNTGDFEGSRSRAIFNIHKKLSNGKALMPSTVGFVFDREKKTEAEIKDLMRESNNCVVFTKRRMFENYIIHPKAIHAVLNSEEGINVSEDAILKWIDENRWNGEKGCIASKYIKEKNLDDWLNYVDGAKFLRTLFTELAGTAVFYDKAKHSTSIAEWVIENSFDDLKEYQELLSALLNKQ